MSAWTLVGILTILLMVENFLLWRLTRLLPLVRSDVVFWRARYLNTKAVLEASWKIGSE